MQIVKDGRNHAHHSLDISVSATIQVSAPSILREEVRSRSLEFPLKSTFIAIRGQTFLLRINIVDSCAQNIRGKATMTHSQQLRSQKQEKPFLRPGFNAQAAVSSAALWTAPQLWQRCAATLTFHIFCTVTRWEMQHAPRHR